MKRIDHSGLITHEILGSTPRLATKKDLAIGKNVVSLCKQIKKMNTILEISTVNSYESYYEEELMPSVDLVFL